MNKHHVRDCLQADFMVQMLNYPCGSTSWGSCPWTFFLWRRGPSATLKVSGNTATSSFRQGYCSETVVKIHHPDADPDWLVGISKAGTEKFHFLRSGFSFTLFGGFGPECWKLVFCFLLFFRRWGSRYGTVLTGCWRLDFGIHFDIHRIFMRVFACSRTEWFGWWASRTIGRRLLSSFLFLLQLVMMNYANDHPAMQRWC